MCPWYVLTSGDAMGASEVLLCEVSDAKCPVILDKAEIGIWMYMAIVALPGA